MICGPGALSAALTVGATLHDDRDWATAVKLAGSLPAIAVAALVVYLCLRFAAQFLHKLGPNGTAVFKIGRASCRGRGFHSVSISVVTVSLKKKKRNIDRN